jgi:ATP-dependent DNA helicase RecG
MQVETSITELFRLNDFQKKALGKLGIKTLLDLIYHFPARYGDTSEMRNIGSLTKGESSVVFGKINGLKMSKSFRSKIPMAEGTIEDETGKIKAVWFNQPYLAKMTAEGALVRIEGKVSERRKTGELYFSNPKIEKVNKLPAGVGDSLFGEEDEAHSLYPVYSESRGITSNWIYHAIQKIFKADILDNITDSVPEEILKKYNLPGLRTALIWIHLPKTRANALAARKRFAFEEIFLIQLERQKSRREYQKQKTFEIRPTDESVQKFVSRFPFESTEAQRKAMETILSDFKGGRAMSRLLEGDVGSGKTAVAATTAYAAIMSKPTGREYGHLQVAYMCPTEILAAQHFESFIKYFEYLGVSIGLITGSGCRKFPSKVNPRSSTDISRSQLLKWVANGEIPILIGTHALIQKSVKFKNLAYVIIDEQHRFGVNQRSALVRKLMTDSTQTTRDPARLDAEQKKSVLSLQGSAAIPHLLSMTATPIPRTLALTMYGDLDLTLLDQMPVGRKPIATEIVLPNKREEVYEKIRSELSSGRQAYVICPRIDEPDPTKELALNAKSVKEEARRLKKSVFPEYEIGILHSKMKDSDKEKVMNDFKAGKIQILCATSVVEVGVNVENATVIIIEGAERFGLAQLHQLRGRVIRSNHQAYCFVFAETKSGKTIERLRALQTAKNGFELAEYDLKFRGAGELSGARQWGVSDIAMEALQNLKMVEAARAEAIRLIDEDSELSNYPSLKQRVKSKVGEFHFE